ncbi:Regulator of G-protein signaling 9-binding protein [Dissostichus eleginoides]|uniref:Regulator of G-protein signaling 9-binding protein n=1 Tax=Dissostichus eleginoides TaxID=100907 RepID=A0AAD9FNT7_DISEL|nr:Regulator of G-protein signaling 9-binding protein [Dissostichus eleginoides]
MEGAKKHSDFQKITRVIFKLLRTYNNWSPIRRAMVENGPLPKNISQTKDWLVDSLKPSLPKGVTSDLLVGNATNWLQTGLQILDEHYQGTSADLRRDLTSLPKEDGERAWMVKFSFATGSSPQAMATPTMWCWLSTGLCPRIASQHGGNKTLNWNLTPSREVLILGESNIARLPLVPDSRVQVDSFPGENLSQAATLIRYKTPTSISSPADQDSISKLQPSIAPTNMSLGEHRALEELQGNKEIILKPADKGGSVVIMDRGQYIREAMRQLEDPSYYLPLDSPIYKETAGLIGEILEGMAKGHWLSKKQASRLISAFKRNHNLGDLLVRAKIPPIVSRFRPPILPSSGPTGSLNTDCRRAAMSSTPWWTNLWTVERGNQPV